MDKVTAINGIIR